MIIKGNVDIRENGELFGKKKEKVKFSREHRPWATLFSYVFTLPASPSTDSYRTDTPKTFIGEASLTGAIALT